MDRIKKQVTSIRSDLQEQIERVVHEVKTKLRTNFTAALNKKVPLLEARVAARINEVLQDTIFTLEELKTIVAAAYES